GTIDYMAPEQALDSTAVDPRADVYSLGCTLYFLLTSRPLYAASSIMGLLLQHREAPPPSLLDARPEAPAVLNAVYLRMVAKKPEDRFPTMTEVIRALEEASQAVHALGAAAVAPRPHVPAGPSAAAITVAAASARQLTGHGVAPSAWEQPTVVSSGSATFR